MFDVAEKEGQFYVVGDGPHAGKAIDKADVLSDIDATKIFFDPAKPKMIKHFGFYNGVRVMRILFEPQFIVMTQPGEKVLAAKNSYNDLKTIIDGILEKKIN